MDFLDVLKFCCYYISLKVDFFYKKRVLWGDDGGIESIVVVEYFGKFLGILVLKIIIIEKLR